MPCSDGYPPDYEKQKTNTKLLMQLNKVEAILCGIMTVLQSTPKLGLSKSPILEEVLSNVDWKKAGVTKKQAVTWWFDHKNKDKNRTIKETALNKLTFAERKALGLIGE